LFRRQRAGDPLREFRAKLVDGELAPGQHSSVTACCIRSGVTPFTLACRANSADPGGLF
jgi:hypothetical protein